MKKTSLAAWGAGALGGYAMLRLLTSGPVELPASSRGAHIVILGAGFGGLAAASRLSRFADQLRISVLDQHNYHLFTPMLYQAATCGIVPSDAAIPVRRWSGHKRLRFRQGTVQQIDLDKKTIHLSHSDLRYDFLVLALGSTTNFFGNDSARRNALPLKTLEDGVLVRNHVIDTLEAAAVSSDAQQRRDLLTYVVVGGGATGVETAGALAGLLREVLRTDYPVLRGEQWRVILLDGCAEAAWPHGRGDGQHRFA
jgi:NADH dehydrogenase